MPNHTESKPQGLLPIGYYAKLIGKLYEDKPGKQLSRVADFVTYHNQRLAEDPRYCTQDIKNDCHFEAIWAVLEHKRAQGGESVA